MVGSYFSVAYSYAFTCAQFYLAQHLGCLCSPHIVVKNERWHGGGGHQVTGMIGGFFGFEIFDSRGFFG